MLTECECSFVTSDALECKVLEDLLESRLCHAILFDSETALFVLQSSKEPSDSLVLLWHTKFEKFAALLQDLYFLEVSS